VERADSSKVDLIDLALAGLGGFDPHQPESEGQRNRPKLLFRFVAGQGSNAANEVLRDTFCGYR
jgi:hypothetical protein